MKIITQSPTAISEAVKILKAGGLVIAPSDTVYGVLVDAQNNKAVEKLIAFKNRPIGKPISVFVENRRMMVENVRISSLQQALLDQLLPGPFTVILDSKHRVHPLLESEKGTLGIRLIDYPFIHQLIKVFGKPLSATSANLSGRPPHYSVESLLREFSQAKKSMIDLVIDAGVLPRNKPSTIIDLTSSKLKILRHGNINLKDLKTYISNTPLETEAIAQLIVKKSLVLSKKKPLIYILEGEMGVGKTIFVKGVGRLFDINDIISPTFVISYEYVINSKEINKLVHCDFFNIEEPEEFKHLGLEQYLVPGNILFIEWGEKGGDLYEMLKNKAHLIHIKMKYGKNKEREIIL